LAERVYSQTDGWAMIALLLLVVGVESITA
jgi:hypothetical protein